MQSLVTPLVALKKASLLQAPFVVSARACVKGFHVSASDPDTHYHEIKDKKSGQVRRLAYHKLSGPRTHGLIYIPGFMAHKLGGKAVAFHSFCQKYGFPYIRYDPSALGDSEGVRLTETRFSLWLEDAREMLLNVTEGPQLVVCSSMGCWITSLLVQKYPEKIAGILMLAPAINFHLRYEKMLLSQLPSTLLHTYNEGGVVTLHAPDYGNIPLSKAVFDDMRKFTLSLDRDSVPISVPVRIIHGVQDKDVDHKQSLPLLHALGTEDVHLTFLKHAGHTLTDPQSLEVIYDTVLRLAEDVDKKTKT